MYRQLCVRHQQRAECLGLCLCSRLCQERGTDSKKNCMKPQAKFFGCECLFLHVLGMLWCCSVLLQVWVIPGRTLVQTMVVMKCGSAACSLSVRMSLRSGITAAFGTSPQQQPFLWKVCVSRRGKGSDGILSFFFRVCQVFDAWGAGECPSQYYCRLGCFKKQKGKVPKRI